VGDSNGVILLLFSFLNAMDEAAEVAFVRQPEVPPDVGKSNMLRFFLSCSEKQNLAVSGTIDKGNGHLCDDDNDDDDEDEEEEEEEDDEEESEDEQDEDDEEDESAVKYTETGSRSQSN
jgi:hypothetical protein